jgi:hypothetical protein
MKKNGLRESLHMFLAYDFYYSSVFQISVLIFLSQNIFFIQSIVNMFVQRKPPREAEADTFPAGEMPSLPKFIISIVCFQ